MEIVQLIASALLVLLIVGFVISARRAGAAAVAIDPNDPLWRAAITRARAAVPEMRKLYDAGHEVWVKFRLATPSGEPEHFWGRVTGVESDTLSVTVETRPVHGGTVPPAVIVNIAELEDWQVQLPDGSIRGGFTTRAQAEMAAKQGVRVPRQIAEMLERMTDK